MRKKFLKRNEIFDSSKTKGVTLIALVVTVMVLIILAGVSVTALTGEKGLIAKVKDAKTRSQDYNDREKTDSDELIKEMEFAENSSTGEALDPMEPIEPGNPSDPFVGQGESESKPIVFNSVEKFVKFIDFSRHSQDYNDGKLPVRYFSLDRDLDFNNPNSYINPNDTSFGDYNHDGVVQGIKDELTNKNGRGLKNGLNFFDVIEGNGHTIKNIWIYDEISGSDSVAAIIHSNRGTIKNITFQGELKTNATSEHAIIKVSGLAGENRGNLINVTNNIDIKFNNYTMPFDGKYPYLYVGGLAGINYGLVDSCCNLANISATVDFNVNEPLPKGNDNICVGGIVGFNNNNVINCINKGNLKGIKQSNVQVPHDYPMDVGGIVAYQELSTHNESMRTKVLVENCINLGNIYSENKSGDARVGGIISKITKNPKFFFENLFNAGEISSSAVTYNYIGGISADGYSTTRDAYNIGNVKVISGNTKYLGALFGDQHNSATEIYNCKYNKVNGLFGAQGKDMSYTIPVNGLTLQMCIDEMNQNVRNHNSSSTDSVWKEWRINGNDVDLIK